ncbi:MAG: hypothetical protein NC937_05235 [Candidatus Omnitrophica bacterium]|nr:hypothetical protein [Candidatus Omnitrophota bacterium]MCM8822788.1 hypothetical protein [Candidatus Omnitrophota bacterium]MCM8825524.1 hypothetical protein [Candidatus Omnitrophota bacterium]MCM8828814.1 hypothetical protein [Candidatus Omnitrophota bacterium]
MKIRLINAVDVHGHFGDYSVRDSFYRKIMTGDLDTVGKRAKRAKTKITIVSPLEAFFPEPGDPISANLKTLEMIKKRHMILRENAFKVFGQKLVSLYYKLKWNQNES